MPKKKKEEQDRKIKADKYKLNLCCKHQQRSYGTEHDEKNCDYCKLEKITSELRGELHGVMIRINDPEYLAKLQLRTY